ncbi:hypothetical protein Dda_8603 [Drechslerella dactyloides]|uniref:Uncharacterized protein n=1 Tax=Drechslerella dactyloides TaxID=74499 RepID=A0AAD6NEX3_DREDA|nr:hypothetical protein Dda_8603 [Drechslerella dactyloides]
MRVDGCGKAAGERFATRIASRAGRISRKKQKQKKKKKQVVLSDPKTQDGAKGDDSIAAL